MYLFTERLSSLICYAWFLFGDVMKGKMCLAVNSGGHFIANKHEVQAALDHRALQERLRGKSGTHSIS